MTGMKRVGAGAALVLWATSAGAQVPVSTKYTNEAWTVTRDWEERSVEAGLAWAASSGLNWQEKYSKWVESLKKVARADGSSGWTFEMTTPYGKTLPAPVIDCADTSMILRVTFAAWHGLPVVIKAGSNYYGHFGIRKGSSGSKSKALCSKCDFSSYTAADIASKGWPSNATLKKKSVGTSDQNPAIGPGARTGAYLDALHLNKRVGFVLIDLLSSAGSMNLAGSTNMYDIKPSAIKGGDVLLERWQANGIGHTIIIKSVTPAAGGKLTVNIAYGSLPPIQPYWEGPVDAYDYLTSEYTGGSDCVDAACKSTYAKLGGGLKRWRAPKKLGGKWVPSVLSDDQGVAIGGSDYAALGARPDEFENILYLPPPEELRDEIVKNIGEYREKLRKKPSGCSARENRENAFSDLYQVMYQEFGKSKLDVDKAYRKLEDYVFAPLDYAKSPTCCWNGSTADMGASVLATAKTAAGAATCASPVVFKKTNGDYQPYRKAAEAAGVSWKAYSNDENCSQGSSPNDAEKSFAATPYCSVRQFLTP